ncbi:lytic transglycosylase domain-containing protein [Aminobacter aganoensis]|uniref:Soluble lytic murein transglycosylase-like protein n=1 Tax=Aminobacter aganoensis TaxID=83264 RepID=A0A7X0FCL4_9HYPH|nr:lytic transglycosylase domain-containing protein [Aminobacter aganoensis]MBB6357221.1 soluble lytic murein transglycosylase-like protein [Aminobacter aganoensis]
MIDRTPINPLDPIARRAADARSEAQGRRPVFRVTVMSSDYARPENCGRRRSLALEQSEHGGRLTAHRIGAPHAVLLVVIVLSASIATCSAYAEPALRSPTGRVANATPPAYPWSAHVAEAAKRFAIPERWIRAVMLVESTNDMRAVSPKGAVGLMQVMPATWQELRAKHGLGDNPFEPRDNILAGTAYLREMLDRFGRKGFLAAYNAGPSRYEQHLTTGRPLPRETLDYVAKLMPIIDGTAAVPSGTRRSAVHHDARRSPIFAQLGDSGNADRTRAEHGSNEHSDNVFMLVGKPDDPPKESDTVSDLTAIEPPAARASNDSGVVARTNDGSLFFRRSADSTP